MMTCGTVIVGRRNLSVLEKSVKVLNMNSLAEFQIKLLFIKKYARCGPLLSSDQRRRFGCPICLFLTAVLFTHQRSISWL